MLDHFPFYLLLLLLIVLLIMLARAIKVAYPILLVLLGLGLGFASGGPAFSIDPELIFIIFLPPLLYEAAWMISWKELWRWRRIVCSFAFIVVFLTALLVALFANYFIPGFSLALGFLLGGIVSPPDAVSAGAILRFVKVPRRLSSILEGESLLNDASSLIVFRFALIAVGTGQFIWQEAALDFVWMVIAGVGIGLLVGWIFMKGHRHLPTDANIDTALTLVAPYLMYIAAEEVHASGVLAVVSGGLLLSTRRNSFLSSSSRIKGFNVWESLSFILNGLVFTLIGLELPHIIAGLETEGVPLPVAAGYGLLVTLVLVVVRLFAAYGAVVTTLVARNFIKVADANHPGFKGPFILGWAGMRGVVSLAAALSIPVHLADGSPFPHRNLILFITFVVILLTLLVQGLTLPVLIRKMELSDPDHPIPEEEVDCQLHRELADFSLKLLRERYCDESKDYLLLQQMVAKWEGKTADTPIAYNSRRALEAYREILEHQRNWLMEKNREDRLLDEDIIRKHLKRLDLEEEKISLL